MRPRGKLLALFVVFAAIGLVTASGAFTTVQAERTAEVSVAGDASALVAIEAGSSDVADDYLQTASEASDNQVAISLTGSFDDGSGNGQGVNQNARTEVDNLFTITNQGSQNVDIRIETTGTNDQYVEFYEGPPDDEDSIVGSSTGNAQDLGPGESVTISMEVETGVGTDDAGLTSGAEILSEITIVAEENT